MYMYMYVCKHALSVFMFQYYKLTKMPRMDLGIRPHYSYMYVCMYIILYTIMDTMHTCTCTYVHMYTLAVLSTQKAMCTQKKFNMGIQGTRHIIGHIILHHVTSHVRCVHGTGPWYAGLPGHVHTHPTHTFLTHKHHSITTPTTETYSFQYMI